VVDSLSMQSYRLKELRADFKVLMTQMRETDDHRWVTGNLGAVPDAEINRVGSSIKFQS